MQIREPVEVFHWIYCNQGSKKEGCGAKNKRASNIGLCVYILKKNRRNKLSNQAFINRPVFHKPTAKNKLWIAGLCCKFF